MTITTTTPPPHTHTIHIFVLILHFQNYDQAAKRRFYQEEKVNYPGGLNPVWRGGVMSSSTCGYFVKRHPTVFSLLS